MKTDEANCNKFKGCQKLQPFSLSVLLFLKQLMIEPKPCDQESTMGLFKNCCQSIYFLNISNKAIVPIAVPKGIAVKST